ncbi:MAG: hypothetical protein GC190_04990 [Alphaproteobacteria bacterium]|nr:hypothetical protein [Alphaproteobacteria bacterium]
MTWLKFGVVALALSFGISAAAAFEIVDTNNGFASPAFLLADPDQDSSSVNVNADDFADKHIYMKGDHEQQFDGYSYSGFVFEDQVQTPSNLVSIDPASVVAATDTSVKADAKQ